MTKFITHHSEAFWGQHSKLLRWSKNGFRGSKKCTGLIFFWWLWGWVKMKVLLHTLGVCTIEPPLPAPKDGAPAFLISLRSCGMEERKDEWGLNDVSSQISKMESDFITVTLWLFLFLLFFGSCSWANTMYYWYIKVYLQSILCLFPLH